jgi:hypothetical protein
MKEFFYEAILSPSKRILGERLYEGTIVKVACFSENMFHAQLLSLRKRVPNQSIGAVTFSEIKNLMSTAIPHHQLKVVPNCQEHYRLLRT